MMGYGETSPVNHDACLERLATERTMVKSLRVENERLRKELDKTTQILTHVKNERDAEGESVSNLENEVEELQQELSDSKEMCRGAVQAATESAKEIERLRKVISVALKYRNVSRGFRAEDKTVELQFVDDHEIDKYEAELRLQLFRELDRLEEG